MTSGTIFRTEGFNAKVNIYSSLMGQGEILSHAFLHIGGLRNSSRLNEDWYFGFDSNVHQNKDFF